MQSTQSVDTVSLNKFDNGCNHWIFRDGTGPRARLVCLHCAADAWLDQTPVRYGDTETLDMPAEHGTLTAYFNWRCRCEECVAEGRNYSKGVMRDRRWLRDRKKAVIDEMVEADAK